VATPPHPVTVAVANKEDGAVAVVDGQMTILFVKQSITFAPVSEEMNVPTVKQRAATPWP
jgi:hypothetical protein